MNVSALKILFRITPARLITLSLFIFVLAWYVSGMSAKICFCWPEKRWATAFGVAGYYLFSLSLLLSSRWKKLEDLLGGLDRIYLIHKKVGIWGFVFLIIHPFAEALKWLPKRVDKFLWFIFPIHGRASVNLGSVAFWLMCILLAITLLKLLPYDKWKRVHKFMSLVFILASLHIILSEKRVGSAFTQFLLYIPMGIGAWAILYKQIYLPIFARKTRLTVSDVVAINDNVIEIAFGVDRTLIPHLPGQYGFITFRDPALSPESHPFTLVDSTDGRGMSIIVKIRGDYTRELFHKVKIGMSAYYEGPHGRLDYKRGFKEQIWIAGGIGVVIFLAWVRAIKSQSASLEKIDFYYCIHRRSDAVFYEEFLSFEKKINGFKIFLHCSEDNNKLAFDQIASASNPLTHKSIYMCGPIKLTEAFNNQFLRYGVPQEQIEYENFEFM